MSVFRIAFASIKKKKKDTISLVLLLFLATMLLISGVVIQTRMADFYYENNERLNAPHYSISIPNNSYKDSYLEFLTGDNRVEYAEIRDAALMNDATYEVNGGKLIIYANFLPIEDNVQINPFSIIEESETPIENPIYVPLFFKGNGYKIGDTVKFTHKGRTYSYNVAGYFETTWFGSSLANMVFFYLPIDAYEEIFAQLGGGQIISARLHNIADVHELRKDFKRETGIQIQSGDRDALNFDSDFYEMQEMSIMIPSLLAVIMLTFSIVILAIVFLVSRFRIYSHIEDHMKNIGVMGAIGNTSRQIRWMLITEYLITGLIGCIPGAIVSYGLINLLGNFISSIMGVKWVSKLHIGTDLFCILIVLMLILVTASICSRKIRKLPPVVALRGGVTAHSFQKNYFPLRGKTFNLQFQLALKNICSNIKQYIMIAIILASVTTASSLALLMYHNMSGADSAIYKMIGFENSNVLIKMAKHQNLDNFKKELMNMKEVDDLSVYSSTTCEIDGDIVTTYISDNFDKLQYVNVYEGSFPKHDNEIVITGTIADLLGKKIGDAVEVTNSGVTANYIICGFTQNMNNMGKMAILSLDGIKRIHPSYQIPDINVYLKDEYNTDDFIAKLEQEFKVLSPENKTTTENMTPEEKARKTAEDKISDLLTQYGVDSAQYALIVDGEIIFSGDSSDYKIEKIDNMKILLESSASSFVSMVGMVATGILVSTLFIIALILYLVVRYTILRKKQEYGIFKSIGFTSTQLRLQIAISFLPVSAIGIAGGCLIAGITLNPIMNILLRPLGITSMAFLSNPAVLTVLFICLLLFVFVISILSSKTIKKITAYELFTE